MSASCPEQGGIRGNATQLKPGSGTICQRSLSLSTRLSSSRLFRPENLFCFFAGSHDHSFLPNWSGLHLTHTLTLNSPFHFIHLTPVRGRCFNFPFSTLQTFNLCLSGQVFHCRVQRDNKTLGLNADTLTTIFSNIKSIYKFHAEFLLPQVS